MKLVNQSFKILEFPKKLLQNVEAAGRTCYKSEDKITESSAEDFVRTLIKSGHFAMIEFGDITVRLITNRGVTHELVRHRLFSFAQESTRYVRYDNEMEFIRPVWWRELSQEERHHFLKTCQSDEHFYRIFIKKYKWSLQQAREVLPHSLKTEIVVKGNIREWRHCLDLRCSRKAHPQFRALALGILKEFYKKSPVFFEDLYAKYIDITEQVN